MRTHPNAFAERGSRHQSATGLTRLELLATLAGVALLGCIALPALANHAQRSTRLVCFGNLRQIGQAIQQWSIDHENRLPWRTPWCEGGTSLPSGTTICLGMTPPAWYQGGLQHNNWFQWLWLSNQLGVPKILACPADTERRPAVDWTGGPGGFLNIHPPGLNLCVSYFVGLDALPEDSLSLMAGDRNLKNSWNGVSSGCSSGLAFNGRIFSSAFQNSNAALVPGAHGEEGNFLFLDGHVEELSSRSLAKRFQVMNEQLGRDNGTTHFMLPQ